MVLNGTTAYVPQQAWIQNETARGNVLFGKDYNDKIYSKVINACSLAVDFQIMPAMIKKIITMKTMIAI